MFAGRAADRTLLGIGIIDKVNGVDSQTTGAGTTRIDFVLYALQTNVNPKTSWTPGTPPVFEYGDSSFGIFGEAARTTRIINHGGAYTTVGATDVPIFMMPKTDKDDLTFAQLGFTFTDTSLTDVLLNAFRPDETDPKGTFNPFMDEHNRYAPGYFGNDGTVTALVTQHTALTTPFIDIDLNPGDVNKHEGLVGISIEVPVYLYSRTPGDDTGTGEDWYFRGGLNNRAPDLGEINTGGAIIIGFGDISADDLGIEVHGGY